MKKFKVISHQSIENFELDLRYFVNRTDIELVHNPIYSTNSESFHDTMPTLMTTRYTAFIQYYEIEQEESE